MLEALGGAAARTLLLAVAVQCVLWLLRIRRAQLLLAAWTVVLVASVAMPMLPQVAPLRIPLTTALPGSLPGSLIGGASGLLQRPLPQGPSGDAGVEAQTEPSPVSWWAAAYLVVGCGILLRVLLGVGLSLRLLSRAVPVRADWAGGTRVRVSRDIRGPVTVANVILVPTDFVHWPVETRQAILAHERAHVARRDFAMLVASQLNRALFWFSPLSWWLHRRLVALTELASDDQAMASSCDRLRYAEILLEMGRRSGSVSHGPAMARPATLSRRIDRILLDQVHPWPVRRSRQVLLTAGVAGLSLAAASLVPQPAVGTLATWRDPDPGRAVDRIGQGGAAGQRAAVQREPVQEAALAPTAPQPGAGAVTRAQPDPVFAPPPPVPVAATALQPPGTVLRQASRRTARAMPKGAPSSLPSWTMARPTQAVTVRWRENDGPSPQDPSMNGTAPRVVRDTDAVTAANSPANETIRSPLSQQIAYGSVAPALPLDFQGIVGSVCTGTVVVGQGAQSSSDKRPYVAAGQLIPARAQFYSKTNGTPWVRFTAFGEPPLDLPVQFSRNGMTWIGNYGITYTVQASGGNHLAGLAGLIRNDSARVDLACVKSVLHLL